MQIHETLEEILEMTLKIEYRLVEGETDGIDEMMDLRHDLLESIQEVKKDHILDAAEMETINKIHLAEDRIRKMACAEMEELRKQAKNVKLGTKAIKNGYMKINEEFRVKRDFSGRG